MSKGKKTFLVIALFVFLFICVHGVTAAAGTAQQSAATELNSAAGQAGLAQGSAVESIGKMIGVVLSILSLILLITVVYAGVEWIIGAGEPERVKKARTMIIEAVIGLAICLSVYGITSFVITKLTTG